MNIKWCHIVLLAAPNEEMNTFLKAPVVEVLLGKVSKHRFYYAIIQCL